MSWNACNLVVLAGGALVSLLAAVMADQPNYAGDKGSGESGSKLAEPKVRILAGSRTTLADAPFFSCSCEALNPNKSPVMIVGYRADSFAPPIEKGRISPIYVVELQREGKWKEHPIGWCGTGMDGIELSTAAQTFDFAVPADATVKAVRVGIRWSRPIPFDTAEPGAFKTAWSESFSLEKLDAKMNKENP